MSSLPTHIMTPAELSRAFEEPRDYEETHGEDENQTPAAQLINLSIRHEYLQRRNEALATNYESLKDEVLRTLDTMRIAREFNTRMTEELAFRNQQIQHYQQREDEANHQIAHLTDRLNEESQEVYDLTLQVASYQDTISDCQDSIVSYQNLVCDIIFGEPEVDIDTFPQLDDTTITMANMLAEDDASSSTLVGTDFSDSDYIFVGHNTGGYYY